MTKQPRSANFLMVANNGADADCSMEVRHYVTLPMPSVPTNRIPTQKLQKLLNQIRYWMYQYIPDDADFHCWLVDEKTRKPSLFLSCLLASREGRLSKAEARALNEKLVPQVTRKQKTTQCRLLVSGNGSALGAAFDEDCEFETCESPEEKEYELLDEAFGSFDSYELVDADHDTNLHVTGEVWQVLTMELPFIPTPESSDAQLRYIVTKTREILFDHAVGHLYDLEIDETDIWIVNDDDTPGLFVTGLLDLRNGTTTSEGIAEQSERALNRCPLNDAACRAA